MGGPHIEAALPLLAATTTVLTTHRAPGAPTLTAPLKAGSRARTVSFTSGSFPPCGLSLSVPAPPSRSRAQPGWGSLRLGQTSWSSPGAQGHT